MPKIKYIVFIYVYGFCYLSPVKEASIYLSSICVSIIYLNAVKICVALIGEY